MRRLPPRRPIRPRWHQLTHRRRPARLRRHSYRLIRRQGLSNRRPHPHRPTLLRQDQPTRRHRRHLLVSVTAPSTSATPSLRGSTELKTVWRSLTPTWPPLTVSYILLVERTWLSFSQATSMISQLCRPLIYVAPASPHWRRVCSTASPRSLCSI